MASLALTSLLESSRLHFVSSYPNITHSIYRSLVELVEDRVKLSLQILKYLPKRFYTDQHLKLLEEKLRITACEAEYSLEERKHDETLSKFEMLSRCDDIDSLNIDLLKTLIPEFSSQEEPLPYVASLHDAEKPKFSFYCIRSKSSKVEKNEFVDFLTAKSKVYSDSGSDMESRIVVRCDYSRIEDWFQIRDWIPSKNMEHEVKDSLYSGTFTLRLDGSFEEVCESLCHHLLDHSYFIVIHNHRIIPRWHGSVYLREDNKKDFWVSDTIFGFHHLVFGERSCPAELQKMAIKIFTTCRASSFASFMVAKYLSMINLTTRNWLIVQQSILTANVFHDKNYRIIQALLKASEIINNKHDEETGISFVMHAIRNKQAEIFEHLKASLEVAEAKDNEKVEIDECLDQLIPELLQSSGQLEKAAIVGMAGIGKTTLAKQILDHASVSSHFHIRTWIDISQFYQKRNILIQLLEGITHLTDDQILNRTDAQLEEKVYKCLKGQRYFIIMDDMWSMKAWRELKRILPDDNLGSRILLTSRESNLIGNLNCKIVHRMSLLSANKSWELLQKKVFGHEICPQGLAVIGKQIAARCGGLPLAIVVVAGLLSKIIKTADSWEVVAESVSSRVMGSESATRAIFALTYEHLPDYLKSCFLYMSTFPGGYEIEVRTLIRLWIAEGFIDKAPPRKWIAEGFDAKAPRKCLEDVAEERLHDLIDRSLLLSGRTRSNGRLKTCRIHDLVLEFCVQEARERKFLDVIKDFCQSD